MMNTDVNIWQCLILIGVGWAMSFVSIAAGVMITMVHKAKKDNQALAEMEMLEEDDNNE